MSGPSAKVIADSMFEGNRLITLEIELHRFVLPEFNTHRSISRNFQSSRAVPVTQMIEQVKNNPAMPVHWGKNEPGMVANEECTNRVYKWNWDEDICGGYDSREEAWKNAAQIAASLAFEFHESGYHKQIVNRLLEPFMWTKGVVTATFNDWQAFLKLRLHKDAQPEIKALACEIAKALLASKPIEKESGEWHLPYVESLENSIEDCIKISASCCGQVSYRKLDDSLEKAIKIYDMLNLPKDGVYPEDPPHFSPTEHQVKFEHGAYKSLSGNFHKHGFIQYRKALELGIEKEVMEK